MLHQDKSRFEGIENVRTTEMWIFKAFFTQLCIWKVSYIISSFVLSFPLISQQDKTSYNRVARVSGEHHMQKIGHRSKRAHQNIRWYTEHTKIRTAAKLYQTRRSASPSWVCPFVMFLDCAAWYWVGEGLSGCDVNWIVGCVVELGRRKNVGWSDDSQTPDFI